MAIKYNTTEAGGSRIEEEGIHTVVIKKVEDKVSKGGNGMLELTLANKEKNEIRYYVVYEGKGAFNFSHLMNVVGVKIKEEGSFDEQKLVGKKFDVNLITNPNDSRYLQVETIGKIGSLEKVEAEEKEEEVTEDGSTEDFWD